MREVNVNPRKVEYIQMKIFQNKTFDHQISFLNLKIYPQSYIDSSPCQIIRQCIFFIGQRFNPIY